MKFQVGLPTFPKSFTLRSKYTDSPAGLEVLVGEAALGFEEGLTVAEVMESGAASANFVSSV